LRRWILPHGLPSSTPERSITDALRIFGRHSKLRKLASIRPPTIRHTISQAKTGELYGELDLAEMFRRRGYQVEFAD
jgi:hypothetical protein